MTTVEHISLSGFYESIIENADSNILILDKNFVIVSLNPRFYWIFLETCDVQLKKGDKLFDVLQPVVPLVAERWRMRCLAALKGLSISDEEDFETHEQKFYWKIYYKAVTLGNEKFVAIYSRNISASKQFQHKILKHEANLRTIINSFQQSVLLVNNQFELIDFNEQAVGHFINFYNVILLPSKNFIDLLPEGIPGLRNRWLDRLNIAIFSGSRGKYIDHMNSGTYELIFETQITPILSEGRVTSLTITTDDITQKRLAEDVHKAHMNELQKLNNELDKFVYSASHDLRGPLLSILGIIDLMQREATFDQLYLDHIRTSVKKLDAFVTNIFNYSSNKKIDVQAEPIDFNRLIDRVVQDLQYLDGASIVKLSCHVIQDIPFYSDLERMTVIFRNLLANVFQYFDKFKDSICVIKIDVTPAIATISIVDNGVGIPPNFLERVFEMFFRASERSTGSGLGLYVVKSTLEKLGGGIAISSMLRQGTEVKMEIPNSQFELG